MHGVDHTFPTGKRGIAVKERNSRKIARGRTVDHRALGQDKPHATLGYWSANLVSDSGDTDIGATGPSPREAVEAVIEHISQESQTPEEDLLPPEVRQQRSKMPWLVAGVLVLALLVYILSQ